MQGIVHVIQNCRFWVRVTLPSDSEQFLNSLPHGQHMHVEWHLCHSKMWSLSSMGGTVARMPASRAFSNEAEGSSG
jgi:hypothetical protein